MRSGFRALDSSVNWNLILWLMTEMRDRVEHRVRKVTVRNKTCVQMPFVSSFFETCFFCSMRNSGLCGFAWQCGLLYSVKHVLTHFSFHACSDTMIIIDCHRAYQRSHLNPGAFGPYPIPLCFGALRLLFPCFRRSFYLPLLLKSLLLRKYSFYLSN